MVAPHDLPVYETGVCTIPPLLNFNITQRHICDKSTITLTLLVLDVLPSLFFVAFIAFPTAVHAQYAPGQRAAVVIYAATMTAVGMSSTALWVYAMLRNLIDETLPERERVRYAGFVGVTPIVFATSIGIAYINAEAAMWSWWLILVAKFVANRVLR
jgi:hypothetical protein